MAYPIKNSGSLIPNSLYLNNYGPIGVNQGGYGLTSSTGFWNGKTPNVNGYITYSGNGASSPTMYISTNDAQLIALSNQLGGSGITTIGNAISYINFGGGTSVCVDSDCPNIFIPQGGLVSLYMDAGYLPSYPKTGNYWYPLTGNGIVGTLTNGVSFSDKSFSFDGTDDAIILNSTTTLGNGNWTVSMWILANSFSSNYGSLLSNSSGGPVTNAFGVTSGRISYQYYLSSWSEQLGSTSLNTGQWYHLTWVNYSPGKMLMYVNGVVDCSLFTSTTNNGGPVNSVGRNWYTTFDGKISTISIYTISLTNTQILQNYYAGLQRLIPTDNLVLWLDGTNTNTRVITPTKAYDMSGNNYDGTFINGASLAHRDGGTVFSFDGIDDRITDSLSTLSTSSTWTIWINRTQSVSFYNMFMSMGLPYFAFRSDGVIQFSNSINGTQQNLTFNSSLSNNVWYHFTFVSSFSGGNTTMIFYLNGVLQAQSTFAGQQATTTLSSYTLGDWAFASYPFKGKIGDARLYSRALTVSEILTMYTAGRPRYGL